MLDAVWCVCLKGISRCVLRSFGAHILDVLVAKEVLVVLSGATVLVRRLMPWIGRDTNDVWEETLHGT